MSLETHHPNDQSQQEEILIAPELPPRLTTNRHMLQKMSKPYVSNQNQFAVLLKNKRQITSLTAGLIVLLGSGVHTVWAFWEIYSATSWLEKEVIIMVGSWYLASLIGSAAAAVLIPKWSKKNIYILAAFILLLSSLLFCSRLFTEFRINSILFSGRFLGGLANGLAYLTVITQAAENAVNQIRGLILRGVGYVLAFSLLIAGFTTNGTIENDIDSELIMGYLNLFYSVLAIILAPFLTIESAPYLLQQTDENTVAEREAIVIATMVKLRNEKCETPKIRHDFIEMKHQLNEDELDSRNPFDRKNIRPLCIVTGVRVLSVCAKNVPFTVLIMGFFNHLFNPETFSLYMLFLLLSCRFIFGMLTMFFIDKFERKKYLYICAILCGILLLITCFVVSNSKEDFFQFSSVFSFGIIVFFVFASMSIDVLGHVQTSEAFSYATKSVSIVIATGVEHIVHTIFIIVFKLQYDVYAFVLISMGLIIMGLSTLLTVPAKTKGLSLRQTRDIYRNVKFVITSESID
ncbi:uncharacterized protein LOC129572508 [Sitodiplosis mosellana]|uniref:uncharacterized protein LOC129572508 n=1 Tax=Sitodiplosis mosellana TaxID=263140 RepID=UPI0024451C31|nr:uncharacterized protein LOC129572508 [Sitodiplosis mosellana]